MKYLLRRLARWIVRTQVTLVWAENTVTDEAMVHTSDLKRLKTAVRMALVRKIADQLIDKDLITFEIRREYGGDYGRGPRHVFSAKLRVV